jgi:hypothetical protein
LAINITVLTAEVGTQPGKKPGTSYQVLDVAFKNNTFGKVEAKKLFGFGAQKGAFDVLSTAQPGQTFDVEIVKNAQGYNDWVSVQPAGAGPVSSVPSAAGAPKTGGNAPAPRGNFETPDERAQRQVYIVRQSSISAAIGTLSVGAKKLDVNEVLAAAKVYEDFVFGKKSAGPSGFEDLPDFPKEIFDNPEVN